MRIAFALPVALALAVGLAVVAQPSGDQAPAGRSLYVSASGSDRGDGSRSRPWRTLRHAAARVEPGDTVHVAAGRYRGPLVIRRGGTEAHGVRFVSEQRWRARISAHGPGAISVVAVRGDHVTFEGFDVAGSGGPGTVGIGVEGNHASVVRNRVHDLRVPCHDDNGGAGIAVGGGSARYRNGDALVDGNLVEDIGHGRRDGTCRFVHGIYVSVPRVTIANNIVTRAIGDGITSWHAARELIVANNLASRNGGVGILVGSGDTGATATGHTGTIVANNIVHRNVMAGISERSDGRHPVGPGNRYLYNLAYANRLGADQASSGLGGLPTDAVVSGTVAADPGFARPTSHPVRRYELAAGSPAVDAGTCVAAPSHDIRGTARPQADAVDIGPHEVPSRPGSCSTVARRLVRRSAGPWRGRARRGPSG